MTYDQKYNKKFIKDLAALRDLVEETARHENEKLLKVNLFESKNNNKNVF